MPTPGYNFDKALTVYVAYVAHVRLKDCFSTIPYGVYI